MAEIPRVYVDRFTDALNRLSRETREKLAEALASIDMSQDVATVRNQVIEVMQTYCGGASDVSATLAAEFYDGLREIEIGERLGAIADSGRKVAATDGAVRAFAQKLVDGKPDEFRELCLERLDYEIKIAAERAVLINGARDSKRPRFARVPTGTETCDFCLMLASRGFVYRSKDSASHSHANCDCRIVPSWKANKVEGYDPKAIYKRWQEAIDAEAKERAERNGTPIAEERQKIMDTYERSASNARVRRKS